ncbi:MAG: TolC family protein [Candidatus Gastranaerophilales bacterium]|nr:TolC family protein [Candidatus Gastranaerophilales bacterium]
MIYKAFNNKLKKKILLILIPAIFFSCFFPAYSKQKPSQVKNADKDVVTLKGKVVTINLQSIVEYILTQSIDLNIVKAQIEQAKYIYRRSFASFLPSISGQLPVEKFQGGEIFYGPIPVSLDRLTYRPAISADYQIFTGGKPIFDMWVYKNQYIRTKISYDTNLQKTLLEACKMYFEWLKNSSDVEVANQALKEIEVQLEYNNSRLKAGFGTQLEVLQTKTLMSDRKNLVLKAENKKDSSRINLATLLNISPAMEMEPEKTFIEPLVLWDKNLTLPQLYDISTKTRPDIKELTYFIAQAKAEYSSSIADLFPSINVGGYLRGIGPDINALDNSAQGALSLNFNLLRNLGVGSWNNIKTAKARFKEAALNKEKLLNDIYKTIAQSYYDCKFYEQQLQVTKEKMKDAKEAYRIALARLKTGVGLNLEVIQAQSELTKSNLEYQTSVRDYNVSQLNLLFECGQLTPDKIQTAFK